jgi:putative endonuclease
MADSILGIQNHPSEGSEHNAGKVKSTKPYRPWKKVYLESYGSEIEAMRREKALKAMKSRIYIQTLIDKTRPD